MSLFLSSPVASASTDGEGIGTEEYQDENWNSTESEITSAATPEPCNIPRIDVGRNVTVAERCTCQAEAPLYPDDYDQYEDDDMTVVVQRSNNEANASDVVDTESELVNVTAGSPINATVPTTQPSGTSERNGMVSDGTPCLAWKKDFEQKIVAGVCKKGKCDRTKTITYTIPTTKRPPYDPFAYHCKVNTTLINSKLEVALGCTASCIGGNNETWNETRLNDGRLCALDTGSGDGDYTNRTGVCRNGSCVTADFTPWTHPNGCIDATVRRNGRVSRIEAAGAGCCYVR
ncbi:hypothetical protein V5799_004357 [Amblyomma americanum]|uniref:Uncharacterized protein n=1 Tax=Amblyomma americanum TaxID=6943 RepID=A0AAQ4D6C1_AMBAM